MEQVVQVLHESLTVDVAFELFTRCLEESLGRYADSLLEDTRPAPDQVRKRLELAAGEEGLMLFTIRDHGKLLGLCGTPRKAKQFVIGNPLVAITMTLHDVRAGLYAPLRILVYETEEHFTRIDYDLPSSLFSQFANPEITKIALTLDAKLANLIDKARRSAEEAPHR